MKKIIIFIVSVLIMSSWGIYADSSTMANFTKTANYKEGQFKDIDTKKWYSQPVQKSFEYAVLKGDSDGNFKPNSNMKISELVTLAARMHKIYNLDQSAFEATSPWYKSYLDYSIKNNIIKENQFTDYEKFANRKDFSNLIYNTFSKHEFTNPEQKEFTFSDIARDSEGGEAVYNLAKAGILSGYTDGTFRPNNNIKRSEVAAICVRVIEKENSKQTTTKKITKEGYTIELISKLPAVLSDHRYKDKIVSSCKITDFNFEASTYTFTDKQTLTLHFSGEKTYDEKGSAKDRACKIFWKLYDLEGYVKNSGKALSPKIKLGEKFNNADDMVFDLEKGSYVLEISDNN